MLTERQKQHFVPAYFGGGYCPPGGGLVISKETFPAHWDRHYDDILDCPLCDRAAAKGGGICPSCAGALKHTQDVLNRRSPGRVVGITDDGIGYAFTPGMSHNDASMRGHGGRHFSFVQPDGSTVSSNNVWCWLEPKPFPKLVAEIRERYGVMRLVLA